MKMNIQLKGFDELQKKLEELGSYENFERMFTNDIIQKVPEARMESGNFRFTRIGSELRLDPDSVSPELYAKIAEVLPY